MTPHDFVCWFRGFTAALGKRPALPDEWEDIKARLNEVTPAAYMGPAYTPGPRPYDGPGTGDLSRGVAARAGQAVDFEAQTVLAQQQQT